MGLTHLIVVALILLAMLAYVFLINRKPKIKDDTLEVDPDADAKAYGRELERMDYFKYTDSKAVLRAKADMMMVFRPEGSFYAGNDPDTDLSYDRRCYYFDFHVLYEKDGVGIFFEDLDTFLHKIDWPPGRVKVREVVEEEQFTAHISVGGNKYVIKRDLNTAEAWNITVLELAELLNTELENYGSIERAYVDLSESWPVLIILTTELHSYILSMFPNDERKIRSPKYWRKMLEES